MVYCKSRGEHPDRLSDCRCRVVITLITTMSSIFNNNSKQAAE